VSTHAPRPRASERAASSTSGAEKVAMPSVIRTANRAPGKSTASNP
jgi:hypothetical protein